MNQRLVSIVLACAILAAGCGGAVKSQEPVVQPGAAPAPATNQTTTPATTPTPTVTGSISIFAGGVHWVGGDGKTTPPHLEGTGAIAGATVILFTGDQVLGKFQTGESGWSEAVTVTVPVDPRLDLLRKEGKADGQPGTVSALITKEGYRPTLLTDIPVYGARAAGYGTNMFAEKDPVQTEGADIPKDAPYVVAQPLDPANQLTRNLVQMVRSQAEQAPVLKGK